ADVAERVLDPLVDDPRQRDRVGLEAVDLPRSDLDLYICVLLVHVTDREEIVLELLPEIGLARLHDELREDLLGREELALDLLAVVVLELDRDALERVLRPLRHADRDEGLRAVRGEPDVLEDDARVPVRLVPVELLNLNDVLLERLLVEEPAGEEATLLGLH